MKRIAWLIELHLNFVADPDRRDGRATQRELLCRAHLDENRLPTVAVGRFPARTEEEVRQMVRKTLKFERDRSAEPWRNRLTLLVGNPGGASVIERRFAAWFVQGVAASRFDRLHPFWTGRIIIHASGSPFCVPDELLREASLRYVQEGQVFLFWGTPALPDSGLMVPRS